MWLYKDDKRKKKEIYNFFVSYNSFVEDYTFERSLKKFEPFFI